MLALVMMVTVFATAASAATASTVRKYSVYLNLGDSIAAGYSMPNYSTSKRKVSVKGSYGQLLSKDILADTYYPYAQQGFRTSEIRMLLDNSYNGDDLTDDEVKTATGGYATKAKLKKQRTQYQNAVKKADLITLDIGFNDVWLPLVSASNENIIMKPAAYTKAALTYFAEFKANYKAILEKIYALNPDVTVVAVGSYNPCKDWDYPAGSGIYVGRLLNPVYSSMNEYKKSFTDTYGSTKYKFCDVSDVEVRTDSTSELTGNGFDPHPTAAGHKYIEKQILSVLPTGPRTSYRSLVKKNGKWVVCKSSGAVDTSYTGLAQNANGIYYVKKGYYASSFTGIVSCNNGRWYIKNGKLQTNYSGTITTKTYKYTVKNGKVVKAVKR